MTNNLSEKKQYVKMANANMQIALNLYFHNACKKGDLENIKYLLTSPDLKIHADIHCNNELGLQHACKYGYSDIIFYLLTSSDLKEKANLSFNNYEPVILSVISADIELIKKITKIKSFATYNHKNNVLHRMFAFTCQLGNLNLIKEMLSDDLFLKAIDPNTKEAHILTILAKNNQLEITKYLLEESSLKNKLKKEFSYQAVINLALTKKSTKFINYALKNKYFNTSEHFEELFIHHHSKWVLKEMWEDNLEIKITKEMAQFFKNNKLEEVEKQINVKNEALKLENELPKKELDKINPKHKL